TIDLAELERLDAEATPGPWQVIDYDGINVVGPRGIIVDDKGFADCALIAAARTAVPALIKRVRELERDNAGMRARLSEIATEREPALFTEMDVHVARADLAVANERIRTLE